MSSKILFITSIILVSSIFSKVNGQEQKVFTEKDCNPNEIPMMIFKGDKVENFCDTAYVLNKYRMKVYEMSKDFVLKSNNQNISKLIKAYDNTLFSVSRSYDSLLQNYRSLDVLFRKTNEDNRMSLLKTQTDLEKATNSLNNTQTQLNEAITKIGRHEKGGWKKKTMFFGGGLVSGILLMLILK